MSELLIEVRTGGLPPGSLAGVTLRLKNSLVRSLRARGLGPRQSSTSFTGRRLMILFRGIPEESETIEVAGPAVTDGLDDDGGATPELETFLAEHDARLEDLRPVEIEGVERLVLDCRQGPAAGERIASAIAEGLGALDLPDPVRWGDGQGPWFRPILGLLVLLDGEVVPLEVLGVTATNTSVGHPILSPRAFPVLGVEDYGEKLAGLGIKARFRDRRDQLQSAFRELAEEVGGVPVEAQALLDQLAAGCEVPGALRGGFDARFLGLPAELVVTALRELRQVIAVEDPDGRLLPFFLAAMDREDDPRGRVRAGFEWSVSGLLEGLGDLYRHDRETPLAQRMGESGGARGDAERPRRLARIAVALAEDIGRAVGSEAAAEAAALLEADRSTEIVRALPSLSGVYGGILARTEGYPESVWQAIYDCGQLRGDALPKSLTGRTVLLAEHLDTLVSLALRRGRPRRGRHGRGQRRRLDGEWPHRRR